MVKAIFRVVFRFRNGLNGTRVFKIAIQILMNKLNGVSDKWNGGSRGVLKEPLKFKRIILTAR